MSRTTDCLCDFCDDVECMHDDSLIASETEADHVIIINPNFKVED